MSEYKERNEKLKVAVTPGQSLDCTQSKTHLCALALRLPGHGAALSGICPYPGGKKGVAARRLLTLALKVKVGCL